MAIKTKRMSDWLPLNGEAVTNACKTSMIRCLNQELRPLQDGVYIGKMQTSESTLQDGSKSYLRCEPWQTTEIGITSGDADCIVIQFGGYCLGIALTEPSYTMSWGSTQAETSIGYKSTSDLNSFDGKARTAGIMASDYYKDDDYESYAVAYCYKYSTSRTASDGSKEEIAQGNWWLPAMGDLALISQHLETINLALQRLKDAGKQSVDLLQQSYYWSCCEYSGASAWILNFKNGNRGINSKVVERALVRPVTALGAGAGNGITGNIVPFDTAKNLTSQDEREDIASAWSIRQLYNMINNIDVTDQLSSYLTIASAKAIYQPIGDYAAASHNHDSVYSKLGHTHNYASTVKVGTTSYTVSSNVITIPAYPTTLPASDVYAWAKASTKPSYAWSELTSKPATLSGYGITDAYTKTEVDDKVTAVADRATTLEGYFTSGSAKKALQLTNSRTLWGQSFNGTANVSGLLTLSDGSHTGLKMGSTYISSLSGNIIFQNNTAIRFGGDAWDYNVWAGLNYIHSSKTINLGLADNSVFQANTAQTGGTLNLVNVNKLVIGGFSLEYDSTNKALKVNGNLYATGGITAYGEGADSSGGGGLNGTVKSYADALKLTSEDLSLLASAYSVAALGDRISTLEGGSATSIVMDGTGNAITGVAKDGTTLTFTKGATFLTSHQDISGKSDKTHTHSVKINGTTKTIAATGGDAVDLGTYLTGITKAQVEAVLTGGITSHTHTFSSITSKPTTLSGYGITDGVNEVATSGTGNAVTSASISGHKLTLTKGSTFSLSTHTHNYTSTVKVGDTSYSVVDNVVSLPAYPVIPTKVSAFTNDSGYTTNKGTVTSVKVTLPTGLTVGTKEITTSGTFDISFTNGYSIPTTAKQTSWDGAVSLQHGHSNKSVIDGISSGNVSNWNSAYNWYVLMTTDETTADGVINKWNEVVNFLANISQTDTLSGIIDGINTSISDEAKRAKAAESANATNIATNKSSIATNATNIATNKSNIATNATNIATNKSNITTLQGYFSSGSAKTALQLTNARKLWGNSFNGTADISGSIVVPSGNYISIGNIKLEYDSDNKALKITNTTTSEVANLYTSGGVTAYGVGTGSSGGGGLNGTIIPYATAIASDPENEGSKVASASSIYKLHSRVSAIETNGATNIAISGTGNAITGVSKDGNIVTYSKDVTFLTSHQSLADYVNAISVTGTGNAVTAISKSGNTLTVTKGATYLTSHQSLADYYTSAQVDTIASGKSATSHTHSVKINGVTKTIAASGDTAVDLGTYLTSHQSLSGYATESWVQSQGYLTAHQSLADYLKSATAESTYSKLGHTHSQYLTSHQDISGKVNYSDVFLGSSANSGMFNKIPRIGTDGVIELGKYIDMHYDNTTNIDYATRIQSTGNYGNSVYLPSASGTLALTSQIPTTLKNPSALSWSGYSSGSYDGSSAQSFVIPNNTNQLTNGAGYDTVSSVNSKLAGYLPLGGGTITGGLEIQGTRDGSGYAKNEGMWTNAQNSIILRGDASYGKSGILFTSSKGTTSINQTSDKGFIQFQPYGGTNTRGESNKLVIGVGNDADDMVYLQTPSSTGLKHVVGTSVYTIWDANNDGSGSGLDADTVDGRHETAFMRTLGVMGSNWNDNINAGCYKVQNPSANIPGNYNYGMGLTLATENHNDGENRVCQIYFSYGSDYAMAIRTHNGDNTFSDSSWTSWAFVPTTNGNIASANQLHTTRTIWGQSFNGTGNVSGALSGATTISASNIISTSYSSFGGLRIENANVSGLGGQLIVHSSIRFGSTAWDWNQWAGLKYDNVNNIIYLGGPDNNIFNANSARTNGTINLRAGISSLLTSSITASGNILATGGITAYSSSDIRLKHNIHSLSCLDVIKSIGGVYEFDYLRDGNHSIGFIAQRVNNPLLADIVDKDDDGYLKINYWSPKLISLAFGAITEIDDEVGRLKDRVRELENEVEQLKSK